MKRLKAMALGVAGTALVATNAHAVDLTGVTLDTATVTALGAVILTALGVLWGVRKVIGLMGR